MSDKKKKFWGVVNEDEFSLRSPRMIEGDEHDTPKGAMDEAMEAILNGEYQKCSIVQCQYYGPDGNGFWGEKENFNGSIEINAEDVGWLTDYIDECWGENA